MSKTEKLKLREIEVLNDNELKTRSTYAYSGSGSGSGSGLSKWQEACVGKDLCQTCDWWDERNQRYIHHGGYCSQNAWAKHRYCFRDRCHC